MNFLEEIKSQIQEKGFFYISNQSEDKLKEILKKLGEVIFVTDITVQAQSKALVTSSKGLGLHTDHHRAKYIVWYCYKQSTVGGETILADAEKVFQKLDKSLQKQLEKIRLYEHKIFPEDCQSYPLVTIKENGQRQFYYSFWLLEEKDKQNPALVEFEQLIKQTEIITLRLEPKDVLIIDNHRILHGRNPIGGDQKRFLKRYWIAINN